MRITAIEPMTCESGIGGRDWLFVKVTTDEGIVGWGEGYDWHAAPALAEAIRMVGSELIGEDPRRIELDQPAAVGLGTVRRSGADEGHRRDRDRPLRHQGQVARRARLRPVRRPVSRADPAVLVALRVVPRASTREALGVEPARSLESWIALVDDVERAGFRALKTNLLVPGLASGLPPTLDGAIDTFRIDAAVEFVGALRDRVGPAMGILFDVGQEYRHGGIVRLARALEPFDLYWLEAEGFDPDALLTAQRQTRTRLCHGEALIRREQFRPFFERHVTDVVMIETLANGLGEARRIADLAAHYDTMFSPHNYMSPLATLINAHLCAALPNCEILEIDMDDVPWKWDIIDQPLEIADGELIVPSRPGPRREHRRGRRRRAPDPGQPVGGLGLRPG